VEYLGGRVRKLSLPRLETPAPASGPILKRLALPQGELAQIHDSDQGMRYLAVIEFKPGRVRGNHYHKRKEESVYIIDGEVRLMVEDIRTRTRESLVLAAGDLVWIGLEVAHAFEPLAPGRAIEFSPSRFAAEDTYRALVTA
jgi:mannose-6-phosphate isomerase-like protein (cupin superfamily)